MEEKKLIGKIQGDSLTFQEAAGRSGWSTAEGGTERKGLPGSARWTSVQHRWPWVGGHMKGLDLSLNRAGDFPKHTLQASLRA